MKYRAYRFSPFRILLEKLRKGMIGREQFKKEWSEEQFRQLYLMDERRG